MKFLLLMMIILVLWWVWRKRAERQGSDLNVPEAKKPEQMVVCAHCGVHHPLSESIVEGVENFCSTAHRLAGKSSEKS